MKENDGSIYEETFKKALIAIEKKYVKGGLCFGEKRFPSIKKEIFSIEDKLNEIWKRNHGNGLKEFRELLKRWYFLNLKMIEEYKKHLKSKNKDNLLNMKV